MSNIIIRPALITECKELAEVFLNSFLRVETNSEMVNNVANRLKIEVEKNIISFLVAEEKGKIIGLGSETLHIGSSYIGYLGVLPSHRKRGIGTSIFKKLLEEAEKHNPTVELFSNLGADSIYRTCGFREEFNAYILKLTLPNDATYENVERLSDSIPSWIYKMDKEAMGFNRSKLLDYLIEREGWDMTFIKNEGYAISDGSCIGPLITNDKETAFNLINQYLSSSPKTITVPDYLESELKQYSPEKLQTCIKMIYGIDLARNQSLVWSYCRFATS